MWPSCLFLSECLKLCRCISSTYWRWCQPHVLWALVGASSRVPGFHQELDEFWPSFLSCRDEVDCVGFPRLLSLGVTLFAIAFLTVFLATRVVAPGFPKLYYWWSFRWDHHLSSLLIHLFFLPDGVHVMAQIFVKVNIILAQGEWSSAKDIGPIFKRCNARQQQTFLNMGNVYVFNIGSICIHRKELLRSFSFHQKYREQSHFETRCLTKNW